MSRVRIPSPAPFTLHVCGSLSPRAWSPRAAGLGRFPTRPQSPVHWGAEVEGAFVRLGEPQNRLVAAEEPTRSVEPGLEAPDDPDAPLEACIAGTATEEDVGRDHLALLDVGASPISGGQAMRSRSSWCGLVFEGARSSDPIPPVRGGSCSRVTTWPRPGSGRASQCDRSRRSSFSVFRIRSRDEFVSQVRHRPRPARPALSG